MEQSERWARAMERLREHARQMGVTDEDIQQALRYVYEGWSTREETRIAGGESSVGTSTSPGAEPTSELSSEAESDS